jgi:LPXTG-motif cell wall-anchored protein
MPASFIKALPPCQSFPRPDLLLARKMERIAQSGILPLMQDTVRIVAGVLCLVLIAIIFVRRKKKKGEADDEF